MLRSPCAQVNDDDDDDDKEANNASSIEPTMNLPPDREEKRGNLRKKNQNHATIVHYSFPRSVVHIFLLHSHPQNF